MKPLSERDENFQVILDVNPGFSDDVGMKPLSERDENRVVTEHFSKPVYSVGMKPLSERDENLGHWKCHLISNFL